MLPEVVEVPGPSFEAMMSAIPGAMEQITRSERILYFTLAAARGRIVPLRCLFNALYGLKPEADWPENDGIIKVYVCKIRRKVPSANIITHHGIGYSMECAS